MRARCITKVLGCNYENDNSIGYGDDLHITGDLTLRKEG